MEELLQTLVENELLTEETKKELIESINAEVEKAKEEAITEAKAEVEAQVRTELAEQYVTDKEALVEALDTKAEEYLKEEVEELKDDIERFRDLEVEYAEKLTEAKEELSQVLKGDMEELVETIDSFLDMRLSDEVSELKEDIDGVRKLQFGAEIYEAFEAMFNQKFINENGLQDDLKEGQARLADLEEQLEETSKELDSVKRDKKLDEILESLHGNTKEVMETVLKNIPTDKLEEAYAHYITKVLHEGAQSTDAESEKESEEDSSVLAEGETVETKDSEKKEDEVTTEGTVVATGDGEKLTEEDSDNEEEPLSEELKETLGRLKVLSGQQV
jgi:hypothetical protein